MRRTLLDMTQSILSEMDGDEVNSIADTTESLQVANIIKTKYYDLIARGSLPEQTMFLSLDSSGDLAKPVLMTIPEAVSRIDWVKYLNESNPPAVYNYVNIMTNQEFLDYTDGFNTDESYVGTFSFTEDGNTFTFKYRNDHQPTYCTVVENNYLIFDSYDETLDSTLQASKTIAAGVKVSLFLMQDNFIPDLEDNQFALLYNEAKALAFYELKQMPNSKAEQEIKRQWSSVGRNKSIVNKPTYFDQLPNFGRQGRTATWNRMRWMRP